MDGSLTARAIEAIAAGPVVRMLGYQPHLRAGGIANYIGHLAIALQARGVQIDGADLRQMFRIQPYLPHEILHIPLIMGAQALLTGRYRRSVVTVLDLGGLLCDHDRASQPLLHKTIFRLALQGVRRASHVIAISHYTKHMLVEHLGIEAERITVTPLGVDHDRYQPRRQAAARKLLADQLGLAFPPDQPVLLYVGSELPRKNLTTLWAALQQIRAAYPGAIVLKVGKAGGLPNQRETTLRDIATYCVADAVRFFDNIDDATLPLLYNAADVFVQPSVYEGFSLPTAEAMASGCPVVAARATCLPDVLGDAGLLFEPLDPAQLAAQAIALHEHAAQRHDLTQRGLVRAQQFNWHTTAEQTLNVYRRLG